MQGLTIKNKIKSLYAGIFILAISEAIIAYVQSTYLNQFFNLTLVSAIFIITYLLTFFIINLYSNIIAKYNNLSTGISALILKSLSLLIFIISANPIIIFFGFIIFTVSFTLVFINFDIFLEACTINVKTGTIRGTYFTFYNLGWLVSPFISGVILQYFGFNLLFWIDLILTLVVLVILGFSFNNFKNHLKAKKFKITRTIREILRKPSLKKIFTISFLLHFFYAIMVVYMPIYLSQYIGLSWTEIGIIFTAMLLPFVLMQYPAGYIADKYIGEQEMIIIGLMIMAFISILVFFVNTQSLLIWGIILFLSRVGASLTEIMRETYFFKKVDAEDIDLINALRSITPLSYILAPLIVGIVLLFLPLNYIFIILGIILFLGLYPAVTLKDTK